jgi:hypothetical protein
MNMSLKMKNTRLKDLTHKVQLMFKYKLTKEEGEQCTANLQASYASLPKSLMPQHREMFIRLVYNSLTFKNRVRFGGRAAVPCTFCGEDEERTQHVFFDCHVIKATKALLKFHAYSLGRLSFRAALLMETRQHYLSLYKYASPTTDQPTLINHVLLPTFYFPIAVWYARKRIHDTPRPDSDDEEELNEEEVQDNNARIIAEEFWKLCSARQGPRALGLIPNAPLPEEYKPK